MKLQHHSKIQNNLNQDQSEIEQMNLLIQFEARLKHAICEVLLYQSFQCSHFNIDKIIMQIHQCLIQGNSASILQ
jgi:hypothetical protein